MFLAIYDFTAIFAEVTLHYIKSYLEWPKYKTAKPLLYTAYKTRNRNS